MIAVTASVTDTNALERSLGRDHFDTQSRQEVIWSPERSPLLHTLTGPEFTEPDILGYHAGGIPGAAAQLLLGAGLFLWALKGGKPR